MTPKKTIVRDATYSLPDGKPIKPFPGFTLKETAFVHWYTNPGTEAFLNSGRAAQRAGYKGNSVMQGYLLQQKPRIAEKINSFIIPTAEKLRETTWRAIHLLAIRMFFDVADFYRPAKRIVKIRGKETEIDVYELVPLNELTWKQNMCIDGIDYRGPHSIPIYKLPDREKSFTLFMKYYKILCPERNKDAMDAAKTAEIIRERVKSPLLNVGSEKAQLKAMATLCNANKG